MVWPILVERYDKIWWNRVRGKDVVTFVMSSWHCWIVIIRIFYCCCKCVRYAEKMEVFIDHVNTWNCCIQMQTFILVLWFVSFVTWTLKGEYHLEGNFNFKILFHIFEYKCYLSTEMWSLSDDPRSEVFCSEASLFGQLSFSALRRIFIILKFHT